MFKIQLFIITVFLFIASPAKAEVVSIADPQAAVPNSAEGIMRPVRGTNMKAVAKRFGEPVNKFSAVGEPPITRWEYEQFEVFFEYDKVIHSTIKRP